MMKNHSTQLKKKPKASPRKKILGWLGRGLGLAVCSILKNPWSWLCLLGFTLLIHTWYGPDIWYHLFLGNKILTNLEFQPPDSLLMVQENFVNFYWFFQVVIAWIHQWGGISGVTLFFASLWVAIAVLWASTTQIRNANSWGLILGLSAIIICQTRFEERPEIFSYLFMMIDIYLIQHWDANCSFPLKRGLLMIFVQILWSNSHGFFILGPAIMGLKTSCLFLETFISGYFSGHRTGSTTVTASSRFQGALRAAGWTAALSIGSLVSPFGYKIWIHSFELWRFLQEMGPAIQEFVSPFSYGWTFWNLIVFWLLFAATAIYAYDLLSRTRKHFFSVLLASVGLYLSSSSVRNLPLFIFMSAPLWNIAILEFCASSVFTKLYAYLGWVRVLSGAICLALTAWVYDQGYFRSLGQSSRFGLGVSSFTYPIKLQQQLKQMVPIKGHWFNHPSAGSYLEFHFPEMKLYSDSRFVDFSPVSEYFFALDDPEIFSIIDKRQTFDYALLSLVDSPHLSSYLLQNYEWKLIYGDLTWVLFEKKANRSLKLEWRVYGGEDLAEKSSGRAAIQWIQILIQTHQRKLLVATLQQLSKARVVPSPILYLTLSYLMPRADGELLKHVLQLRPKMLALAEADRIAVDSLIDKTPLDFDGPANQ